MHTQPTLFPFTYTVDAEEVRNQLTLFEVKLASLRAELHKRMKWRARYLHRNGDGFGVRPSQRYKARGYHALDLHRKSIGMYDAWVRAGHAKLRLIEAAQSIEWRAAA